MFTFGVFLFVWLLQTVLQTVPELDLQQITVLGFIAPFLTQVIKLVFNVVLKKQISKVYVTGIVFAVSLVLGYFWSGVELVFTGDLLADATMLVTVASGILGVATLVYNVILEKILEGVGALKVFTQSGVLKSLGVK